MKHVHLQMKNPDGEWVTLATHDSQRPPGSITSADIHGVEQVYLFGWHRGEGPAVWRSIGGLNIADSAERLVVTSGLDLIADLEEGPFELQWRRPQAEVPLRFSLQ